MSRRCLTLAVVTAAVSAIPLLPAGAQEYDRSASGTRWLESEGGGTAIRMLVEASNLGSGEVEIGEITFPPNAAPTQGHQHGSIEIFYVLEGELDHVVNGESHPLSPGMVGIVKPGDSVMHRTGPEPVRALVIWAPGGEADRIARFFRVRPVGEGR